MVRFCSVSFPSISLCLIVICVGEAVASGFWAVWVKVSDRFLLDLIGGLDLDLYLTSRHADVAFDI